MQNVIDTIASQYANSPTITTLIDAMNQYIDPAADIEQFLNFVWNVDTAQGFGLDIWGRIVNVPRTLTVPGAMVYFGFDEGVPGAQPFDQAPFYNGPPATETFVLSDDAYRVLILTKALSNITAANAPGLNALLQNLFIGRGRAYVRDLGSMSMEFVFEFAMLPFEIAVVTQSGAIPRPAGVQASVLQFDAAGTFGFAEQGGLAQPFDQGVFFNPDIAIIPII